MADKIDNLLSCFALHLKPSSSSDPFALRRQAFALIKMIIENKLSCHLPELLEKSLLIFLENPELAATDARRFSDEKAEIVQELLHFIEGRMRTLFVQMGFAKDRIEAILSGGVIAPYESYIKLSALEAFAKERAVQFEALLEMYTRTKKITQNRTLSVPIKEELLSDKEEKQLFIELKKMEERIPQASYEEALLLLTELQPRLSAFFDHVVVMVEERTVSNNRLALLQRLCALFEGLLDFTKLQI